MGAATTITMDSFERLLWWLFAGSAGARTRALVLSSIKQEPRNAQQLSVALHVDYTTVRHHLRVLESNRLVLTEGEKYGKIYFVSENMEAHWDKLEAILKRSKHPGSMGGGKR
jgi:DNA-binding transcriptional ArsR family regulator